jgi:hypothetical protein
LIIGANTFNANVTLLLMISYEVVSHIYVLCSLMLNRIVSELHSTFVVTKQRHWLEVDSKIPQSGLHP